MNNIINKIKLSKFDFYNCKINCSISVLDKIHEYRNIFDITQTYRIKRIVCSCMKEIIDELYN